MPTEPPGGTDAGTAGEHPTALEDRDRPSVPTPRVEGAGGLDHEGQEPGSIDLNDAPDQGEDGDVGVSATDGPPVEPVEPIDPEDPLGPDEVPDAGARPPIDPRIRQRRVAIQRSQGRKRLLWLGGATGLVVLVVLVVALAHTPWFGAQAITVTGTHPRTSEAAIVNAAGLQHHPPLISLNPGTVARRVESLPFIASAHVERHWPDGVQIAVTEREPVVQMAGPGSSWSLLDGHGRTLQVVPGRVPGLVVYIVHTADSGVPPAPVGSSLPASADPGLVVGRTLPPAFVAQVVSVTVAADGSISLALDSGVTVLFGSDADRTAKYQDVAAVLANGTLHATSVIDVTVPESPTVSG